MADLQAIVERTVSGLGYQLVDIEASPRARLLRIFIDRLPPETTDEATANALKSNITVDDCAAVSHQLTRVLTVENIDYDRLEVSSPGMDRPLKTLADYRRFVDCTVHLKLRLPEGSQRNFSGVLLGPLDSGEPQVRLMTENGERIFAFDNIDKARLVPKF